MQDSQSDSNEIFFQETAMYSKTILQKLERITGASFPSVEHNINDNTLKIEVVTERPIDQIDSKIIKALADRYVLTLIDGEMENKLPLSMERGNLAPIPLEDRFWITYHVEIKPMTDHQIISGQLMRSWGTEIFVETVETDVDKLVVSFKTNLSLERVDFLFREALEEFDLIKEQSYLTPCDDAHGYGDGAFEYEFNKISKSNLEKINIGKRLDAFIPENWASACADIIKEHSIFDNIVTIDKVTVNGCPDCKDGFYYPLIGKPEPCRTCK